LRPRLLAGQSASSLRSMFAHIPSQRDSDPPCGLHLAGGCMSQSVITAPTLS
jgi:hypothetical protein